jgi:hypothetical protein
MKKILVVIICLAGFTLSAQDDVYKIIANETCECLKTRDISKLKSRSEVEMVMGICMLESAGRQNLDMDLTDREAMRKVGEKVGVQMVLICPDAFKKVLVEGESEPEPEWFTGQVKSVDVGEFVYLNFKEESGKEHRLIWTRYFPGSDDYQDNPKKLVGKKVRVLFQTVEYFSPKMKTYYLAKEITNLQVE